MLKDELKRRNLSIKDIQKESNIPYTTLNDLVNGRTDIDNVGTRVLVAVSNSLGISMDDAYRLCKENQPVKEGRIEVKGKKYLLIYNNRQYELCSVNKDNTEYIKEIAMTAIKNLQEEERITSWH